MSVCNEKFFVRNSANYLYILSKSLVPKCEQSLATGEVIAHAAAPLYLP